MLIVGTNHFVSFSAACSYYSDQEEGLSPKELGQLVKEKLLDGSICVGPPSLKDGQKLRLIDEGRRWAIEEQESKRLIVVNVGDK